MQFFSGTLFPLLVTVIFQKITNRCSPCCKKFILQILLYYGNIYLIKWAINIPLIIKHHKATRHISGRSQTKNIAVYGENDPSFSLINFFEEEFSNMKYKTILGDFFRNERQFHLACRYFVRINRTTC